MNNDRNKTTAPAGSQCLSLFDFGVSLRSLQKILTAVEEHFAE